MGNGVDIFEMVKLCGKWLKFLTKDLNMWRMTERFGKWLNIWEMA